MNKKGFTLIEVLIVIALIGILASVVLVSLQGGKNDAKDKSALSTFVSTQPEAIRCMTKTSYPGVRLSSSNVASAICQYNNGGTLTDVPGFANWPDVSGAGNGWTAVMRTGTPVNDSSADGFYWCDLGNYPTNHPTGAGSYLDGTRGGDKGDGRVCYMLKNGTKYIWCTETGCATQGF